MAPALPQIILHWLSGPWRLMLGTPAAGGTWVFCSNGVCVCVTVCLSCGSSMPRPPPPHTLLCPSALRIETLASCVCVCVRTACVCDSCDPPYVVLSISNLRLSGGVTMVAQATSHRWVCLRSRCLTTTGLFLSAHLFPVPDITSTHRHTTQRPPLTPGVEGDGGIEGETEGGRERVRERYRQEDRGGESWRE